MDEHGGREDGMKEEEEEDGGEAMMDDQNHNNWGAYGRYLLEERLLPPAGPPRPAGTEHNGGAVRGCEPAGTAGRAGAAGAIAAINISASTSKFLMNVITIEDYKSTYWPKLDSAIDQLLTQSPGDYIPISYEQIYSCVYKCVCQQHSEQMYSDLIKKITNHLERVSKELQASPPDLYIERFNIALGQYMGALQSIVPLFIYMNKFYIETKLNRDLKDDLIKLFTEHVAEKHIYNLMPLLLEAQSTPFQITPSTMANIVKGLYTLRPEWVQMAPALFSKFIPNVLPPAVESELQEYAAQDQKLQRELIQNGFTRGDQSRKRPGEELYNCWSDRPLHNNSTNPSGGSEAGKSWSCHDNSPAVVESPSLEGFQSCVDVALGDMGYGEWNIISGEKKSERGGGGNCSQMNRSRPASAVPPACPLDLAAAQRFHANAIKESSDSRRS
ncbi:CDK2-associated and cullin domain-containing protein 1 [Pitangus sulphuratus]|nr:CDK2-associated and cullin domain-containing protein 1 [Pitangus sulphuratus]